MLNISERARQLVILSGKGGTGKTSLCAAFADLSQKTGSPVNSVFVDADVDAANLSLVLTPKVANVHKFMGGSLAEINANLCAGCGACVAVCRYDALFTDSKNSAIYQVDPISCEGCAACMYACPQNAIHLVQQNEGNWYQSETPYGPFFHAELFPGKENSGKLVTMVKQQARLWAEDIHASLVIIDGPPGIGCPVISACAGADLGLIVTEPSLAGLHDLKRILGTLEHFRVPTLICINKGDIYPEGTRQIRAYANEKGIEILGEIPFDENIPLAMMQGAPITAVFPTSPASIAIQKIWDKAIRFILRQED